MSEYALDIVKTSKYLEPMGDHELIRVKRHFGPSVAREVRPTTVKTLEEFVELLDENDLERERNKKLKEKEQSAADKAKGTANNKLAESGKKAWLKNTNVIANNKLKNDRERGANPTKDDAGTEYAKDGKINAKNVNKNAAESEKDNDASSKGEKNASRKNFSARSKVAAVSAETNTDDSEEEERDAGASPKLAALKPKSKKGIASNKLKRDRVNAEKFAKATLKAAKAKTNAACTEKPGASRIDVVSDVKPKSIALPTMAGRARKSSGKPKLNERVDESANITSANTVEISSESRNSAKETVRRTVSVRE
ncbi:histone H1-like [Camponotus floridanus]|uniref:histone H1-like n=1 Tax=Camponotus floridanus TaxID=104421 RepID=UPI000DC6760E|nr:histone H1-like [Camponotus floridanus]